MAAVLLLSFFGLMIIGVPISFSMGISTLFAIIYEGLPLEVFPQKAFSGIDSFPMMAVPFFILAADLMTSGKITDLLVGFANAIVGHIRGGLGHVNVLVSVFFAGISGSALADAAGTGAIEMDMMVKAGYDRDYSGAMTAASAVIGPIIPPSIIMVMYALTEGRTSVIGLFLAGIIPGLLIAASLMIMNHIISTKRGYRFSSQRPTILHILKSFIKSLPGMFMPAIILGGIMLGWFTPTEAAAVAVAYALVVGFFITRSLTVKELPKIVLGSALVSSSVLLVVAMGSAFSFALTYAQIPQKVAMWVGGLTSSPLLVLILIMLVSVVTGMFVDTLPSVVILTPVLAPVASQFGIAPLQTAMVICVSLAFGMITPPVAPVLFVVSSVRQVKFERLCVAVLPLIAAEFCVLLLLTLVPQFSTWLPSLMGYVR